MAETPKETRQEYDVPWTLTGRTRVIAANATEAKLKFDQIEVSEYAERDGELESFHAVLRVED